jgi:hypothetical protein
LNGAQLQRKAGVISQQKHQKITRIMEYVSKSAPNADANEQHK